MNPVDGAEEKTGWMEEDGTDEGDTFLDPSDLEKKKRATNEYHAQGNTAQTQIFIQNLSNLNTGHRQKSRAVRIRQEGKTFDLRRPEECSEFVETYKDSEYLAIAIILSTFEAVALGDIPDLEAKLMECLPASVQQTGEDGEVHPQRDPYLSLDTVLGVIGGERFIAADGRACMGFGENTRQILANLLVLFPVLRGVVITWLNRVYEIYQCRTGFDAYQIMTAFASVISLDFTDAKTRIFPRLYSDSGNAGLLGNLAYRLYEESATRKEAKGLILQWLGSDSSWLWRPGCLASVFLMNRGTELVLEDEVYRVVSKRFFTFRGSDFGFLASLLIQSVFFRTICAEVISDVYMGATDREERLSVVRIYLGLIRRSYYRVKASALLLPLAACDTAEQQELLAPVIGQAMSVYHLRRQLYAILKVYLEELARYNYPADVINHISAFFYNMAFLETQYRQDILYFLKNCTGRAAEAVFERLCRAYEKEENQKNE